MIRKLRVLLLRVALAPMIFVAVFTRPSWSTGSVGAFLVESAGYVFLLAGLWIRIWSILYVGARKSQELVTCGPYSICRNPLYIGTFLLAIGAGLCFENLLMLIAMVTVIVPVHMFTARLEEKHLMSKFPEEYPRYVSEVPRFWPRLRTYRSEETVTVSTRAIWRIAVDTMAVLWIPQIEDVLELLHQHGIVPVLWHFP